MKVRIGLGISAWPFPGTTPTPLFDFVAHCDRMGIDSLWFSDRVIGPRRVLDPVVTVAALAAASKTMKFGTNALNLPPRNPVVLAKELATLDFLSGGRLLLVVGLGSDDSRDYEASGSTRGQRGSRTDEAIAVLRTLWTEDGASFEGRHFRFHDVTIEPKPSQRPGPPIWIGGRSEAALRRTGRLGDGWLPASITPEECAEGIEAIREYAAEAGREVPEDHYGVTLPCGIAGSRDAALEMAGPALTRRRPDVAAEELGAFGTPDDVIRRIEEYRAAGVTKFVLQPACPQASWLSQVEVMASEVIRPVQTPFTDEELRERAGASRL